jgi:hypothetical protein
MGPAGFLISGGDVTVLALKVSHRAFLHLHRRTRAPAASQIRLVLSSAPYGSAIRYQPQSYVIMRLHVQTTKIENSFVYLRDAASWRAQYLHELTSFLNGRHRDQVNSSWRAIAGLSNGTGGATGSSFCKTRAPSRCAPSVFLSRF